MAAKIKAMLLGIQVRAKNCLSAFLSVLKLLFGSLLKDLAWFGSFILIVLGGAALVAHRNTKNAAAAKVAVSLIEQGHQQQIQQLQQQIATSQQLQVQAITAMNQAQKAVDQKKQSLAQSYDKAGLSTDEIVSRLSQLDI